MDEPAVAACPTCQQPKHPKSATCRACAIKAGVYRRACSLAGRAAAKVRLRTLMVTRGWTETHAQIYLAGWHAGRHAAYAARTRSSKHSDTT